MTHTVTLERGQHRDDLSRQWAARPADQRFLSLSALHARTHNWAQQSRSETIIPADIEIDVEGDDVIAGLKGVALRPTHYGMGALARIAGVPSSYIRDQRVPAELAAACLANGLATADQDAVAAYLRDPAGEAAPTLRALTSPRYGRIFDFEVADAVMKIAGDGIGDTRWKVPGTIDWSSATAGGVAYNPDTPITKESTTLYASDRDLFLFLCDDRNPVEVGLLPNGDPDLMFRAFYVWNSEVGERTFGLATMWLRAVCQNRTLWGVEDFEQTVIRHTSGAPDRFATDFAPLLEGYAEASVTAMADRVAATKAITFDDAQSETQVDFLIDRMGFNRKQAVAILATDPDGADALEPGRAPGSLWELSNAATAWARSIPHQDARLTAEQAVARAVNLAIA